MLLVVLCVIGLSVVLFVILLFGLSGFLGFLWLLYGLADDGNSICKKCYLVYLFVITGEGGSYLQCFDPLRHSF